MVNPAPAAYEFSSWEINIFSGDKKEEGTFDSSPTVKKGDTHTATDFINRLIQNQYILTVAAQGDEREENRAVIANSEQKCLLCSDGFPYDDEDLQALCKKHNIPSNTMKLEMACNLTLLLKGEEKSTTAGPPCLKDSGEVAGANDSKIVTNEPKKVRFGLENENIEILDLQKDPYGKFSAEMKSDARRSKY
ncbi:hypothetical protein HHK36_007997 [Tetracentron sinense]|uniref:Uncharacterized protein n=1 Tax=Tetracentron sinense TaxID=13715 RepID=A0A835DMZ8_TETSI|nr:hypothetical protein HHK36_007997 [Tetracentron sinense]